MAASQMARVSDVEEGQPLLHLDSKEPLKNEESATLPPRSKEYLHSSAFKRIVLRRNLLLLYVLCALVSTSSLLYSFRQRVNCYSADQNQSSDATVIKTAKEDVECKPFDYPCLINEASRIFERLLARQPSTVSAALEDYRRIHQRDPPPGMKGWYEYAFASNAKIINDYGQLEADLRPFREAGMSKGDKDSMITSFMSRFHDSNALSSLVGVLSVQNGRASCSGETWRKGGMTNSTLLEIIRPIADSLPDLSLVYNWNPRPMVFGTESWSAQAPERVQFNDISHKSAWNLLRKPCPNRYTTNSTIASARESIDVCNIEGIHAEEHGMFVSSQTLFATENLIPIVSRAKMSTNRDILAPNVCYWTDHYRHWDLVDHIPFEKKRKSVYWRGATTGVVLSQRTWLKSHRMRFVAFAHYLRIKALAAWRHRNGLSATDLPPGSEDAAVPVDSGSHEELELQRFSSVEVDEYAAQLDPLMLDISLHTIYDATDKAINELTRKSYGMAKYRKANYQLEHQFQADIDGESMSCRFYFQLASNSVPIKQTLFAEWHDDRIIPWLHYIPISTNYGDLPRLLAWLVTDEGQMYARMIAKAGQDWAALALRREDITLYYYRLLLEYASIYSQ